ncbi:MAG: hypothetical protein QOI16_2963 [Pseudonocardiales bacterium]|jgi:hypothetical protein|nr:hypothetical protein [Pseudonocardiales bacterium]
MIVWARWTARRRRREDEEMDPTRTHDIVLQDATGFVGALVAAYLAEHA